MQKVIQRGCVILFGFSLVMCSHRLRNLKTSQLKSIYALFPTIKITELDHQHFHDTPMWNLFIHNRQKC